MARLEQRERDLVDSGGFGEVGLRHAVEKIAGRDDLEARRTYFFLDVLVFRHIFIITLMFLAIWSRIAE